MLVTCDKEWGIIARRLSAQLQVQSGKPKQVVEFPVVSNCERNHSLQGSVERWKVNCPSMIGVNEETMCGNAHLRVRARAMNDICWIDTLTTHPHTGERAEGPRRRRDRPIHGDSWRNGERRRKAESRPALTTFTSRCLSRTSFNDTAKRPNQHLHNQTVINHNPGDPFQSNDHDGKRENGGGSVLSGKEASGVDQRCALILFRSTQLWLMLMSASSLPAPVDAPS